MLNNSPQLFEVCFKYISPEGLFRIAAPHSRPPLRIIKALVDHNSLETLKLLCQACPNLIKLQLIFAHSEVLIDGVILAAVQYCPLIEELPTQSMCLTDTALNALATISTLKTLKLYPRRCTSAAIQRVLQSNRANLLTISIEGEFVDDALVRCIGRCCGNLKSLKLVLYGTLAFSDSSLQDLFRGCSQLEVLTLRQHAGGMSSATLQALFQYCQRLVELDLSINTVTSVNSEFVLHTPYPTLTKLRLTGKGVDDQTLRDIFTYCSNLKEVSLSGCIEVTDETMSVLAHSCNSLCQLALCYCTSISVTITGMLEVATYCSSLTVLYLCSMPISDKVLLQLSLNCRHLTSLQAQLCTGGPVTEVGIVTLLQACTGMTRLTIQNHILTYVPAVLDPTMNVEKLGQLYPHIKYNLRQLRCQVHDGIYIYMYIILYIHISIS